MTSVVQGTTTEYVSNNSVVYDQVGHDQGSKFEFLVSIQVDTSNIKSGIHP